ncbi:MAG: hypothetical protein AABY96_08520 [Nitrospirota bacterium]
MGTSRDEPTAPYVGRSSSSWSCLYSQGAGVMAEAEFMPEARALYQRVLARYSNREWAYDVDRAKAALAGLQDSTPAVVAFRSDPLLSR